jgi:hypothetical protein
MSDASRNKPQTNCDKDSYEPPRLTLMGNLNDLLAQNIVSPNCDNTIGTGSGTGTDQC